MALPDYEVEARQCIQDGVSLAGKDCILKSVADRNLDLIALMQSDGIDFTWNDILWDWDEYAYLSPLYVAVDMQDAELVSLLRSYGSKVDNSCVLHQLAKAYNVDGINFLNSYAADNGVPIDWSSAATRGYYVGKTPIEVASSLWYYYEDPVDEAATRLQALQDSCDAVSAMLDLGVSVPIDTLLYNAVWAVNTDLLDLLLQHSADNGISIDWTSRSPEGYTLLSRAAYYGNVGLATTLIEAGAPISGSEMLHMATLANHSSFVSDMLTYCGNNGIAIDINEVGSIVGLSPRAVASAFGRNDVESILAANGGTIIMVPGAYSIDSLCKAMRFNLNHYVEFIADYAADNAITIDWNQPDEYGTYPLAVAYNSPDPTIADFLISLGADPDLLIVDEETMYDM